MQVSARNQFSGTVAAVKEGAVNGVVAVDLGGTLIKAGVTMESIAELGLVEGTRATVAVKASGVLLFPGSERLPISVHNQFEGTVVRIERGAVNALATLTTPDGLSFVGELANKDLDALGLAVGLPAVAAVKSTDVMVGLA